jgi:hypothetical protein
LGVVGALSIFGLVRRDGTFAGGLLTFDLVSGFQVAQHNCGQYHFRSAAFSSQLEEMVGGTLTRASSMCVGLGVGGATIASGSRARPLNSWTSRLLTSSLSLGVCSLFCRATRFREFSSSDPLPWTRPSPTPPGLVCESLQYHQVVTLCLS